jgi:hypothetical protein
MADSAALLVDEVLPYQPMRQWVLRFLLASKPSIMGKALGIVYHTIATHLTRKAGYTKTTAHTGAVTLIQCFGGALNLNIHFHMLYAAFVQPAIPFVVLNNHAALLFVLLIILSLISFCSLNHYDFLFQCRVGCKDRQKGTSHHYASAPASS